MILLLDPSLLVPSGTESAAGTIEFWRRLSEWSGDNRVRVGPRTVAHAVDFYGRHGYPQSRINIGPREFPRDAQRALNTLLARALPEAQSHSPRQLCGPYLGDEVEGTVLAEDIGHSAAHQTLMGLATDTTLWPSGDVTATCSPAPPACLALCTRPCDVLPAEARSSVQAFFAGKRLNIVGGKQDQAAAAYWQDEFGLDVPVRWIPAEKNKSPQNLAKAWGGLQRDRDIGICISGRIGHQASGVAQATCHKRGVTYLPVESVGKVAAALTALSRESAGTYD